MTSIEPYEQPTTDIAQPTAAPVAQTQAAGLVAWAQAAKAAHGIAKSLSATSFVPKAMQDKPDEITAAILVGQEIGLSPMAALRSIHMIHGTPALNANSLRAVAQSRGHKIWLVSESPAKAVVRGQRRGEEEIQESVWTIQRAEQAGFPQKNPNWKTQPQAMLVARATSVVARLVASDALLGMPYSAEELEDGLASEPAKRTVRRRKLEAVPVPEPEQTPAEQAIDAAVEQGEPEQAAGDSADPWAGEESGAWPEVAQPGSGARDAR